MRFRESRYADSTLSRLTFEDIEAASDGHGGDS
jgi:hypothetical protein